MEPLVDKLARQEIVKRLFAGIRAWDKQSDKLKRFFIVAPCATVAIICFTILLIPFWDDNSILSLLACVVWFIVAWPLVVASSFFQHNT